MNDDSSDRIVAALRAWIATVAPGTQLPTSRQLVREHGASPVTVQRAIRTLVNQGVVESRPGVGSFVRAQRTARPRDYGWQSAALGAPRQTLPRGAGAMRTAPTDVHALHSGYPEPALLPERMVRAALIRAARSDAATHRASAAGLTALRNWFAGELAADTPAHLSAPTAHDVVIVPGTQSGLTSIFRSLVVAGGPLLIESPSYWGAIVAGHQAGVRMLPITSDDEGPDPTALDRALRESGARALYAQPNFANPTGRQWSHQRTEDVLAVIRQHDAFLIDDDWAHDFGIDADSRPAAALDDGGHVIHLRSLTKSLSPTIRIGAVIARGPVRDRVLADRSAESMYVSGLLQHAALEVVSDPGWTSHLRRLRGQLRERRDLLIEALAEHAPSAQVTARPAGGIHLWLRLPDGADADLVTAECERRGVWVSSGNEWFAAEPLGPHLRLNFTGPNPGGFVAAAKTLGAVLAGSPPDTP